MISSSVITDLSDKNWKVRAEALDKLKSLLSEAKFITPNLGELATPLKTRLNDTNKNLATQFINFTESLGAALGPGVKQHTRNIIPAILGAMGDSKATVRTAALSCLRVWCEHCGFTSLLDGEMLLEALKQDNPYLRSELLGWLAENLNETKSVSNSDLNVLVPLIYTFIEDRSADVRKRSQEIILPIMIHVGYDPMLRAADKVKPASKSAILAHLEKAKPNVPAKPSKAASSNQQKKKAKDVEDGCGSGGGGGGGASKRAPSKTRKAEATTNKSSKKKDDDVETGPPLQTNNLKEQRSFDEKALKTLKWNFTVPRDEYYEQLKDQAATAGFSRSLQANMFHQDFKYHLKAIETLTDCVNTCPVSII